MLHPRRWQSLAAISLIVGLVLVLSDGFVIAIPGIGRAIGGSADQMAWAVNGFSLAAGMAGFFGRLGDLTGNRRLVVAGSAVLIVGSVVGGLAETPGELILARVLQGIGGIAIFTCSLSVVTLEFPPEERPRALGINAATRWAASGLAVLIIAMLLVSLEWRWIFWAAIPVTLLGIGLVISTTPEVRDPKAGSQLDLAGALTMTAAFVVLVYALFESDEVPVMTLILMFAIFAFLLGIFILIEGRSADPLIPLQIWRHRIFTGAMVVNFIFNGILMGVLYLLALYLQTAKGLGMVDAAGVLLGATITIIVINPFGARLARRGYFLAPVVAGMLLVAAGCATVLVGVKVDSNSMIVGGLVVLGAAVGIQLASISAFQVSSGDIAKGTVSALLVVTIGISNALGIALATAIMQNVAIRSLQSVTGSNDLEGVSHQKLLDVLNGSQPSSSVSPAGQQVVIAAFNHGTVVTSAIFAVLSLLGAGLALMMLRDISLAED